MPHKLDVLRVTISTNRAKLAWVTFLKARTVNDNFHLAVQNGNQMDFHVFPQVPAKAMAREEGIDRVLKCLQGENKALCSQIFLGKEDLEIQLKNHAEYD